MFGQVGYFPVPLKDIAPGRGADHSTPAATRPALNQGTRSNGQDTWIEMGSIPFWKGGRVEADNLHDAGTGDSDVAFDAVAFVPSVTYVQGVCGFGY